MADSPRAAGLNGFPNAIPDSSRIRGPKVRWPDDAPFGVWLTHDVDRVRKTYQYATDLLTRRRVPDFRPLVRGDDPYFNFYRILDLESSLGVRSTFFLLEESTRLSPAPRTWPISMGKYRFSEPRIAEVIRYVRTRGWEVGLHGSYRSYMSEGLLRREKEDLERVLGEPVVAIRQHYLNLEIPTTWQLQQGVGFKLDASFGRITELGFRDNHFWPFRPNGVDILAAPLVIPDAAILQRGWSAEETRAQVGAVLSKAVETHALVTVLWHQRFLNPKEFPFHWKMYRWLIEEAHRRNAWFGLAADLLTIWGG